MRQCSLFSYWELLLSQDSEVRCMQVSEKKIGKQVTGKGVDREHLVGCHSGPLTIIMKIKFKENKRQQVVPPQKGSTDGHWGGLSQKCPPQFQAFEHLVLHWCSLDGGSTALEVGFEIKKSLHCMLLFHAYYSEACELAVSCTSCYTLALPPHPTMGSYPLEP